MDTIQRFGGMPPYIEKVGVAYGFDRSIGGDPRAILLAEAKNNRIIQRIQDAIGQADTARPENKAAILNRAIELLWLLKVMVEATESALLDVHATHELDVSELMKVIDNASRHSSCDGDRVERDDVGSAQVGLDQDDHGQSGGGEPREGEPDYDGDSGRNRRRGQRR